jgi:hypothetical protein
MLSTPRGDSNSESDDSGSFLPGAAETGENSSPWFPSSGSGTSRARKRDRSLAGEGWRPRAIHAAVDADPCAARSSVRHASVAEEDHQTSGPGVELSLGRSCVEDKTPCAIARSVSTNTNRKMPILPISDLSRFPACCGPAPQGRARWTLRMLAGKLVELEVVESISPETVRSTLKKCG